jgi:hypothetical protein
MWSTIGAKIADTCSTDGGRPRGTDPRGDHRFGLVSLPAGKRRPLTPTKSALASLSYCFHGGCAVWFRRMDLQFRRSEG